MFAFTYANVFVAPNFLALVIVLIDALTMAVINSRRIHTTHLQPNDNKVVVTL